MEVDGKRVRVDEDVGVHLLRGVGERGVLAGDLVAVLVHLVDERLLSGEEHNGEEASALGLVGVGDLVLVGVFRGAHLTGVREVRNEEVALFEVFGAAQLLPEPLGYLHGEVHEGDLARKVLLETGGKVALWGEGAVLALGARADATQAAGNVRARLTVVQVKLALREEGAAAIKVEDVQYGMADPEHVPSHSLESRYRPLHASPDAMN